MPRSVSRDCVQSGVAHQQIHIATLHCRESLGGGQRHEVHGRRVAQDNCCHHTAEVNVEAREGAVGNYLGECDSRSRYAAFQFAAILHLRQQIAMGDVVYNIFRIAASVVRVGHAVSGFVGGLGGLPRGCGVPCAYEVCGHLGAWRGGGGGGFGCVGGDVVVGETDGGLSELVAGEIARAGFDSVEQACGEAGDLCGGERCCGV